MDGRRRQGWALVGALLLTVAGMLPVTLTGALAVQLRAALDISGTWLGLLVASFFIGGSLLSTTVGRAADRAGWRRATVVTSLVSIAVFVAMATVVTGPWPGVLVLAVAGAVMSAGVSTSNVVVARELPGHRLGLLLGLKQSAVPIAGLASGLAVPLVALTLGWRWAFVIACAVPAAVIAITRVLPSSSAPGRDGSRELPRGNGEVARGTAGAQVPDGPSSEPATFVVSRRLRLLSIALIFASVLPGVLAGFTVVTAVDAGMAEGAAGTLLAVCSLLGVGIRVGAGAGLDRVRPDGVRVVAVMLAVGTLGSALLATGRLGLLVPGALLAFAGGWGWPGVLFYDVLRDHPTRPAAASGVIQATSMGGTAVGPLSFGWITDTAGVGTAWLVVAVVSGVSAVLVGLAARLERPAGSLHHADDAADTSAA